MTDDLAGTCDECNQNVQRPIAQGERNTIPLDHSGHRRQSERPECCDPAVLRIHDRGSAWEVSEDSSMAHRCNWRAWQGSPNKVGEKFASSLSPIRDARAGTKG